MAARRPRVALLHWGDLIEDFLDQIDVSVDAFCERMSGGWMFGFVDALQGADVDTVLIIVSSTVRRPTRRRHTATGATIWVLPPTRTYRRLRAAVPDRYAWSTREAIAGASGASRVAAAVAHQLTGYAATPTRALAGVLRSERCAALLCQEYEHPRFDVCVLLGTALRMPVFATFQGGDRQQTWVERFVRPWTVRRAAGLLVGPDSEAARVRQRYRVRADKLTQVFNPLDVDAWTPADRAESRREADLPESHVVVAWHGRVDMHRKGLDVLVDAWDELTSSTSSPVRLLLIGSGVDRERLRARLDGRPDVRWFDEYLTDPDAVRRLLSAADIYAFPSRHEGFPVAPVEALALGLPVVAATAPGVTEILAGGERSSGGVVVPTGDATAFASALRQLVEDPGLRATLSSAARRRANECFSPVAVGTVLRQVLVDGGRRSAAGADGLR